jgi:hypothetical protein
MVRFAEIEEEYIELGSPSFWLCWFLEMIWSDGYRW